MSLDNLPKAIRSQVEAAIEFEKQIAAPVIETAPSTLDAALVEPPKVEPVARQEPEKPAPPKVEPAPTPSTDWEQKYKTLQGMTQSQLSTIQKQANAAEAERAEVARKLEAMKQELATLKQAKPTVDPKDVETFGAEWVDMVRRQASADIERALSVALGPLTARLDALESGTQGIGQQVAYTVEQQFYTALGQAVPDYAAINKNPKFLGWLAQEDPVYGKTRQSALDAAANSYSVERTASIFNAFKALSATAKPANAELESQVAPARSSAAAAPTDAKPIISQRDIKKFYDDAARGRYQGSPEDFARTEAIINAAMAEGRVSA